VVMRWDQVLVGNAFNTWREWAQEVAHQTALSQATMTRWSQMLLSRTFNTWRQWANAMNVSAQWENVSTDLATSNLLASSLSQWQAHTAASLKTEMQIELSQMHHLSKLSADLTHGVNQWSNTIKISKQASAALQYATQHHCTGVLSRCFSLWNSQRVRVVDSVLLENFWAAQQANAVAQCWDSWCVATLEKFDDMGNMEVATNYIQKTALVMMRIRSMEKHTSQLILVRATQHFRQFQMSETLLWWQWVNTQHTAAESLQVQNTQQQLQRDVHTAFSAMRVSAADRAFSAVRLLYAIERIFRSRLHSAFTKWHSGTIEVLMSIEKEIVAEEKSILPMLGLWHHLTKSGKMQLQALTTGGLHRKNKVLTDNFQCWRKMLVGWDNKKLGALSAVPTSRRRALAPRNWQEKSLGAPMQKTKSRVQSRTSLSDKSQNLAQRRHNVDGLLTEVMSDLALERTYVALQHWQTSHLKKCLKRWHKYSK